jgi:hypothetical protein
MISSTVTTETVILFRQTLPPSTTCHIFELQPSHMTSHRYPTIARGTPILKRTCKDNDQFCRNDEAEKVESPGLLMEFSSRGRRENIRLPCQPDRAFLFPAQSFQQVFYGNRPSAATPLSVAAVTLRKTSALRNASRRFPWLRSSLSSQPSSTYLHFCVCLGLNVSYLLPFIKPVVFFLVTPEK